MPWVKLDDQFPDHPKVVRAGPAAAWLYVCGLAYCARQLTNGEIPAAQLPKLIGGRAHHLAARLVEVALWETTDGGYRVHDYLKYNPSRDQVLALRKQKADAGRRGGYQKAGTVPGERQPSASATSAAPVPTPQPVPQPTASTQTEHLPEETETVPSTHTAGVRVLAVNGSAAYSEDFEEFWADYPKKREKHAAWLAWERRRKDTPVADLKAASRNLAEHVEENGTEDQYVPNAATFLGPQRKYADFVNGVPRSTQRGKRDEPKGYDGLREHFADLERPALEAAR